jgi:DNA-binding NarL/FixJ family response regulator
MTGGSLSAMNAPTPVPQILLVEDDHLTAGCIREFLSDLGFIVLGSASSAFEAMGFAEACRPDVALGHRPIKGIERTRCRGSVESG